MMKMGGSRWMVNFFVGNLVMIGVGIHSFVESSGTPACHRNPVFCSGPLLEAVQMARIFPDSKTFVDMSIKKDPHEVLEDFNQLKEQGKLQTKEELEEFVNTNFAGPGDELEEWDPSDWTVDPPLLARIKDFAYKDWAVELIKLWKVLGRKMSPHVKEHPEQHSLLYVPNPFIVPGDRFREFYYWDSFWIVDGLLLSGMQLTVRGMLENFLYILNQVGFIPNGGRIYFLNRSQPPMFLPMVHLYYEATKDLEFIRNNIESLEKEYNFWKNNRTVEFTVPSKDGLPEETLRLNRYYVNLGQPRPEGYAEDIHSAQNLTGSEKEAKYADLASGAESGWDYSTRWFDHHGEHTFKLESVRTTDIVPVDLNAILLWNEHILSKFHGLIGDASKESMYQQLAVQRSEVMNRVMWNEDMGTWLDYDLKNQKQRDQFYASNIIPLFTMKKAGIENLEEKTAKVIEYLTAEHVLTYPGGVPTSKIPSNQQWDFPNAWAPLVYFVVEALANCEQPEAQALALNVSQVWLASNFEAWETNGHMYEKYDVRQKGAVGGGGEYSVQIGFGWTNGVILHLLNRYGNHTTTSRHTIVSGPPITSSSVYIIVILTVIGVAALIVVLVIFTRRRLSRRNPTGSKSGNNVYEPCTVKLNDSKS